MNPVLLRLETHGGAVEFVDGQPGALLERWQNGDLMTTEHPKYKSAQLWWANNTAARERKFKQPAGPAKIEPKRK